MQFTVINHVKTPLLMRILNFSLDHFMSYSFYSYFQLALDATTREGKARCPSWVKKHESSKPKEIQKSCLCHSQYHDGSVPQHRPERCSRTRSCQQNEGRTVSMAKQQGRGRQHAQGRAPGLPQHGEDCLHNACDSHNPLRCLGISVGNEIRQTQKVHAPTWDLRELISRNTTALPRG